MYTAVYVDGKLLDDSVRQIKAPAASAYYFWTTLEPNADGSERTGLDGYVVREVTISSPDPTVSPDDGKVTGYGTVTPIESGESQSLTASMKLDSQESIEGNTISFTFSGSDVLTVTNTLDGTVPSGLSSNIRTALALIALPLLPVGCILYCKRRRRKAAV